MNMGPGPWSIPIYDSAILHKLETLGISGVCSDRGLLKKTITFCSQTPRWVSEENMSFVGRKKKRKKLIWKKIRNFVRSCNNCLLVVNHVLKLKKIFSNLQCPKSHWSSHPASGLQKVRRYKDQLASAQHTTRNMMTLEVFFVFFRLEVGRCFQKQRICKLINVCTCKYP